MSDVKASEQLTSQTASLVKLGCTLMEHGEGAKAVALFNQLLAANPTDPLLRESAHMVLGHQVPKFHLGMLADQSRNVAYERAIVRASPGRTVLDIGAGSGLLAMMAARAGAQVVFACEANQALAATAHEIVCANQLEGLVRVIGKHSNELSSEADLGGAVDVIVTEIFSENLIGEGVLPTMRDAIGRLGMPGAAVIPARGSIRVALADFADAGSRKAGEVSGFDLALFNRHGPTSFTLGVGERALKLRSDPADLFDFDFATAAFALEMKAWVRLMSTGGRISGIVQWIRLQLDAEETYENAPGAGARSHWSVNYHPLSSEIESAQGEEIVVNGWRDDHRVAIWTDD